MFVPHYVCQVDEGRHTVIAEKPTTVQVATHHHDYCIIHIVGDIFDKCICYV